MMQTQEVGSNLVRKRWEKVGEEATWSNQQSHKTSSENAQKTNKWDTCQQMKHGHNSHFQGLLVYKTLYRLLNFKISLYIIMHKLIYLLLFVNVAHTNLYYLMWIFFYVVSFYKKNSFTLLFFLQHYFIIIYLLFEKILNY